MADFNSNQKHPKIDYIGTYPNLIVEQGVDGHQLIRSIEPGHESSWEIHPDGNYEGHGNGGVNVKVTVAKQYSYCADGVSSTVDGHSETAIAGSQHNSIAGGSSNEIKDNAYHAMGGVKIESAGGSAIQSSAGGNHFNTTTGDIVTQHDGDKHDSVQGDYIKQTTGHDVEIISGEKAINIISGNMDTQVNSGKYRVKAAQDIIINSDTRISLIVGSSTIVIEPGKITITSSDVEFVQG